MGVTAKITHFLIAAHSAAINLKDFLIMSDSYLFYTYTDYKYYLFVFITLFNYNLLACKISRRTSYICNCFKPKTHKNGNGNGNGRAQNRDKLQCCQMYYRYMQVVGNWNRTKRKHRVRNLTCFMHFCANCKQSCYKFHCADRVDVTD